MNVQDREWPKLINAFAVAEAAGLDHEAIVRRMATGQVAVSEALDEIYAQVLPAARPNAPRSREVLKGTALKDE